MEKHENASAADVDRWLRDVEKIARAVAGDALRTTGADAWLRNGVWRAHCELAGNIVEHEAATLAGAAFGLRTACLRELGEIGKRALALLSEHGAAVATDAAWSAGHYVAGREIRATHATLDGVVVEIARLVERSGLARTPLDSGSWSLKAIVHGTSLAVTGDTLDAAVYQARQALALIEKRQAPPTIADGAGTLQQAWIPEWIQRAVDVAVKHGAEYAVYDQGPAGTRSVGVWFMVGTFGNVGAATDALDAAGFATASHGPTQTFANREWRP